jgi:uncharacterized damage-inducible protein DinB
LTSTSDAIARVIACAKRSLAMAEQLFGRLLEHNNWANDQIIRACAGLSDEQLDAEPRTAAWGSIRSTLLHLVSAQRGYLSLLTLPLDARPKTPLAFADLPQSVIHSGEALLALVQGDLPTARLQTRDGHLVDPWVVLVQAIDHAAEHREQIKSMLSALGVTPPDIDGWSYGEVAGALLPS